MKDTEYLMSLNDEEFKNILNMIDNERYRRNASEILARQKRYRDDPDKKYAGTKYMREKYKENKEEFDKRKKEYNRQINEPTILASKEAGIYKSRWTDVDDKILLSLREEGREYTYISTVLNRTVKALKTRFFRLQSKKD